MKNTQIILYVLTGFLFSCGSREEKKETVINNKITLTPDQIRLGNITFGSAEKRNISEVVSSIGIIEVPPQNLVSVSIPMGGYLKYTDLLPGSKVAKGQVLARVQNLQFVELQQEYLTAKAKLEFADAEFKRQLELYKEKAGSEKVMQQAKSEAALYNISLHALEEKLKILGINPSSVNPSGIKSEINIVSPVNGFVASLKVNTGKFVEPKEVIMDLVNPSDIHLKLKVYEKDLNKLSVGQSVTCWTNADPAKKYNAKIILIGQVFSEDKSVEVHCHFEDGNTKLTPGIYMNAEIASANADALCLPETALTRWQNENYVFYKKADGVVEMIPVSAGNPNDGWVSVSFTNNFNPTDINFVTRGAEWVLMKFKNLE